MKNKEEKGLKAALNGVVRDVVVIRLLGEELRKHGFWYKVKGARLHGAAFRYEMEITFKEGGAWWKFTVFIPQDVEGEITVKGYKHNPGYNHDVLKQRQRKDAVKAVVEETLARIEKEAEEEEEAL